MIRLHNRYNPFILIFLCVVAFTSLAFRACSSCSEHRHEEQVEEQEEIIPINLLLDNSLSDLEQTKLFDNEIKKFMRRWELKGVSFALMRNDSLLYAKGYGMATDSEECEVKHVFRIASASKLLTATAVMKLCESDRLDLSTKVFGAEGILNDSTLLDLHSSRHKSITVEHLLHHTSGLYSPLGDPAFANYSVARTLGRELPLTLDDMVEYATRCRVRYMPGDHYDYSNLGYMILGKVVERVSGMSYESFVRDSILAPAGCYDMFVGRNFSKNRAPNEVQYYEVKEAEPVEAYDGSGKMTMKSNGGNNVTLLGAAGGWVASPAELLRLVAAINGGGSKADILSKESVKTMTYDSRRYKPIGWASVNGTQWMRSGSMAGTSALIKKQKDGYTWVFVTNCSAWIGPYFSNHISTSVSRAVGRVKQWPVRDLFTYEPPEPEPVAQEENNQQDD